MIEILGGLLSLILGAGFFGVLAFIGIGVVLTLIIRFVVGVFRWILNIPKGKRYTVTIDKKGSDDKSWRIFF